jgi:hypothetical protein
MKGFVWLNRYSILQNGLKGCGGAGEKQARYDSSQFFLIYPVKHHNARFPSVIVAVRTKRAEPFLSPVHDVW